MSKVTDKVLDSYILAGYGDNVRILIFTHRLRKLTGLSWSECRRWSRQWMGDFYRSNDEAREAAVFCARHINDKGPRRHGGPQ